MGTNYSKWPQMKAKISLHETKDKYFSPYKSNHSQEKKTPKEVKKNPDQLLGCGVSMNEL